MKLMQVIKERGFVDKADAVTKAEERLSNDYCVPHKPMTRQDDEFAHEGADTDIPGMIPVYDDDRRGNKVTRASPDRKAPPRAKSNPGGMTGFA
jgi:hypothetical protein